MTRLARAIVLIATFSAAPAPPALSGEPGPAAGKKPLSLKECVGIALRANPGLGAARDLAAAARGRTWQARAPLLPQVFGNVSASRSEAPKRTSFFQGFQGTVPENVFEQKTASLSVQQSVVNLSDWKAAASAKSTERAAEASYRWQEQELVLAVAQAYYNYLKSIRLEEVARENLKVGEEQLKLAEKRREVGIGVEADILKARAQNAQDRLGVITAAKDVEIARRLLCGVMGIALDAPIAVDDIPPDEAVGPEPEADVEAALAARPDLVEQRHRVRAAERSLASARALYLPDLSFDFGYRRLLDATNTVTIADTLGRAVHAVTEFDPYGSWDASLSLNLAIFSGGAREGRVNEARASLRSARETLEQLERDARLEAQTALLDVKAKAEAIQVSREGVRAAEEDLRVTQGSYTQGLLPILNLVQAQAALVQARTSLVTATYDHRIALAQLDRALGRGAAMILQ